MAKTIAKLQAQARKTSSKAPTRNKASGTKSAARAKSKAKTKVRLKQTFTSAISAQKTSGPTACAATPGTAISV